MPNDVWISLNLRTFQRLNFITELQYIEERDTDFNLDDGKLNEINFLTIISFSYVTSIW